MPTYGSIQGADYCLQTMQGNAFDIASLLIGLLRVSGIHSRYVLGTVEIPIDEFMNWGGGFTDPNAAADFFASGGIPTTVLKSGGKIVKVRIEHIWAEAYVDYIPSRGARHKAGQGDTWIPLDASYKQHIYTAPTINIQEVIPFDAQSIIDQIEASATINEEEGWVTNIDSLFIQNTMEGYNAQVEDYIIQNYPDATAGELLCSKEIIKQEYSYLLDTLPYKTSIKGGLYATLPESLRHKLTFKIETSDFDVSPIHITKNLLELAGKKITLSYVPATSEDKALVESYIPEPHPDGTPIDPEELPNSLPAYLIKIIPELRIDGQLIASGNTVGLGRINKFTMIFYDPSFPDGPIINNIDAGEFLVIGFNLGNIPQQLMLQLSERIKWIKGKFEAEDYDVLTKKQLLGDVFFAAATTYHAELDVINSFKAKIAGINTIRLPSENMFFSNVNVSSLMGMPNSVKFGGLVMDVDRLSSVTKALNGDNIKAVKFTLSSGWMSSLLEHGVPERIFSSDNCPGEAISAIKALKIANDQGIPIYSISQSNSNTIIPQLQLNADVKTDIQNAVNTGYEVIVSKNNISFNDWTGCGYIITNPSTGAGAYMIGDGLNGSVYRMLASILAITIGALLIIIGVTASSLSFGASLALVLFGVLFIGLALCLWYQSDIPLAIASFIVLAVALFFIGITGIPGAIFSSLVGTSISIYGYIFSEEIVRDFKNICRGD